MDRPRGAAFFSSLSEMVNLTFRDPNPPREPPDYRTRYFHDMPCAFYFRIVEMVLMAVFTGLTWSCCEGGERTFSVIVGCIGIALIGCLLFWHYFYVSNENYEFSRKVDIFVSVSWFVLFFIASILISVRTEKMSRNHKKNFHHHEYDKAAAGTCFGFFTVVAFLLDGLHLWRAIQSTN